MHAILQKGQYFVMFWSKYIGNNGNILQKKYCSGFGKIAIIYYEENRGRKIIIIIQIPALSNSRTTPLLTEPGHLRKKKLICLSKNYTCRRVLKAIVQDL